MSLSAYQQEVQESQTTLFVFTEDGTLEMSYSNLARVIDLKKKIATSAGVPPEKQKLMIGGKEMTDSESLWSCGVRPMCNVKLYVRTCDTKEMITRAGAESA